MANGERRMFFALGVIFGAVAAIFGCKYGPAIRDKAQKWVEDQTNLLIIKDCCDNCADIGASKKS